MRQPQTRHKKPQRREKKKTKENTCGCQTPWPRGQENVMISRTAEDTLALKYPPERVLEGWGNGFTRQGVQEGVSQILPPPQTPPGHKTPSAFHRPKLSGDARNSIVKRQHNDILRTSRRANCNLEVLKELDHLGGATPRLLRPRASRNYVSK